jgi:hypothetical protein
MSEKVPILVLLGQGTDERWHASRFAETDETLVVRAAELMGFHVVRVSSDNEELYGIAESLPVGKIFSTGRAFVPFVARAAFDKLRALVDGGVIVPAPSEQPADAVLPSAAMFTTEAATAATALWSKIEVGTVVLAAQPDLYGPGWWQVVVVGVDGDDLTLRWVDDPAEEPFRLTRRDVGLRHPGAE